MSYKKHLKEISLFKTLYFNFTYLKWKEAIKFPFIVSKKTCLYSLKGSVIISSRTLKTGMIQIGFGNVPIFDKKYSRTIWNNSGEIEFKGNANIGHGSRIGCGGKIIFGDNFTITAESIIICDNSITFGNDVLLSWGIQIMDTDFHKIYFNNQIQNPDKSISIGDHVWIGSKSTINKGVTLADNIVIASSSVVTKSFIEKNIIIGGNPALVLKNEISWVK